MSIKYSENGNAAIITLNRPNNLNALNYEMITSIEEYLKNINKNKNIKLVIFKGEGEKAFCAGGDVKSFYEEKFTNTNVLPVSENSFTLEDIQDILLGSVTNQVYSS